MISSSLSASQSPLPKSERAASSAPSSAPVDASDCVEHVYAKLRSIAGQFLARERRDHTLQATALVHEAFLKIRRASSQSFEDQQQFVRLASRAMRQVLVNHQRDRARIKRGGGKRKLPIDEVDAAFPEPDVDLLCLDEALERLERIDPRKVEVVQLRFFAGLSVEETAGVVGISTAQVKRDWALAKAWLARELEDGDET